MPRIGAVLNNGIRALHEFGDPDILLLRRKAKIVHVLLDQARQFSRGVFSGRNSSRASPRGMRAVFCVFLGAGWAILLLRIFAIVPFGNWRDDVPFRASKYARLLETVLGARPL